MQTWIFLYIIQSHLKLQKSKMCSTKVESRQRAVWSIGQAKMETQSQFSHSTNFSFSLTQWTELGKKDRSQSSHRVPWLICKIPGLKFKLPCYKQGWIYAVYIFPYQMLSMRFFFTSFDLLNLISVRINI